MITDHIELSEGILVEVELLKGQSKEISGGAKKINLDKIESLLQKICKPIAQSWKKMDKDILVDETEVSLGLSFEAGGNLFVTKSKAGANLSIKMVLKPKR